MKSKLLKSSAVIFVILVFQAFTVKPLQAPLTVLGTINNGIYTIVFDGTIGYCGPISGMPNLTVSDGSQIYTAIGQTGTLCYDSGTGTYYASGKVKFYDANEDLIELFFDEELQ